MHERKKETMEDGHGKFSHDDERVGQGFGVQVRLHSKQGDFKPSIRYFDAKIRPFMGITYTLFF